MDYGRVARIAVGASALVAGAAIAAPVIKDAFGGFDTPPEPMPMPEPQAPSGARDGASAITSVPIAPAPAAEPEPDPEPAPAPEPEPAPAPARRTYVNPVFPMNAPDPTVVRGDDGAFYAYTTESGFLPFMVLKSNDLTSWEIVGTPFEGAGPSWVKEHRWAPDVKKTGDHYTFLYSGRGHDGQMRIGYATSPNPAGPFQDRGILLDSGGSGGYVIDPYLAETPQGWKLLYGSTGGTNPMDQTGISSIDVDIAADGTISTRGAAKVVLSEEGERELVEGAWMHERDGTYYLFYSDGKWDAKGGADDYAVKVARSSSPDGPFEKLGTPILQQGGGWTSTGHNAIVTDDAGQDWMLYHAWGSDPDAGRMLMLDPITWENGWPKVNQGAGPSTTAIDAPVITAREGAATLGQ
jgi:arabinan endo-1,5-alpha-L-arabinosidase